MAEAAGRGNHDRYYQGTSRSRDVPLDALHVPIFGAPKENAGLVLSDRVGCDLGHTSRGLCVTAIRVYESA